MLSGCKGWWHWLYTVFQIANLPACPCYQVGWPLHLKNLAPLCSWWVPVNFVHSQVTMHVDFSSSIRSSTPIVTHFLTKLQSSLCFLIPFISETYFSLIQFHISSWVVFNFRCRFGWFFLAWIGPVPLNPCWLDLLAVRAGYLSLLPLFPRSLLGPLRVGKWKRVQLLQWHLCELELFHRTSALNG